MFRFEKQSGKLTFRFVKFRRPSWAPMGKIWKFVTQDCREMHLQTPEQLKMSLKNSSATKDRRF